MLKLNYREIPSNFWKKYTITKITKWYLDCAMQLIKQNYQVVMNYYILGHLLKCKTNAKVA